METTRHGLGVGVAGFIAIALTACNALPERIETLEEARTSIRSIESDPLAREAASVELAEAREALMLADRAYEEGEDLEMIEHHAYVANQHARIAEQQIAEAHASEQLEQAEAQRTEVLLQARERDVRRAEAQASRQETAATRAERQAALQAARAASAEERAQALAADLEALQAEQTERGLVLTLGDILFDTDEATLKPGAQDTIDDLVGFLEEYPEREVRIEGYTDARGTEAYNVDLSERRARAVEVALEGRGVSDQRIQIVGLGEAYPIASNETAAGRQQNRRVEIVLSDEDGSFDEAASRRSAQANARPSDASPSNVNR